MQQTNYPPSPFQYNAANNRHSLSDNPDVYHAGQPYDNPDAHYSNYRASMSDVKLTERYDSDEEDGFEPLPPRTQKRRSCLDKVCCGCCTCCPKWARYCSCCILITLVIIGIVIGILAAVFKVPQVSFNGLEGEPTVALAGSNVNLNFTLDISVDNPNKMGITFEHIKATAYYPGHHDTSIGGGQLDDVHIDGSGITNISFPFTLSFDTQDTSTASIFSDLLSKCGVTGGSVQDIVIDYDVKPTLRVAGIPISPTISNNAKIPCPREGLDSLGGGLASLVPSGALPTGAI